MGDLVECSCDKNHHGRRNHNNVVKLMNNNSSNATALTSLPPPPSLASNNNLLNTKVANNRYQAMNVSAANAVEMQRAKENAKNYKENIKNNFKHKKFGKHIVIPDGNWEWGGCDDNVNFGYRKSKDFLDARYKKRSDIKTLIKLHNNEAGRLVSWWNLSFWVITSFFFLLLQAIKQFMRLECKVSSPACLSSKLNPKKSVLI